MRLRTWLFAGTSLTLLSMAPASTFAQDAVVELPQACIDLGFKTLEECIVAQQAGEAPAVEAPPPAEEAAPPAEEPAPPVEAAPEPAPEPEPAPPPEPAPEPAPVEVAPEPQPEVQVQEQVEPAPEPQPEPQMQVEAEPEPQPEPAPEPAPEVQQEPAPQPEPQPEAQPAQQQPAVEVAPEPEPAPAVEEQPVEEQPAQLDVVSALTAQVDAHNAAVADIAAGGDANAAQTRIDAALAEINALCANVGMPDIESCLAPLGLSLDPVPAIAPPAEQTPPPAEQTPPPAEQVPPAAEQPTVDPNAPPAQPTEVPVTTDGQPAEIVQDLPAGVTQEQIAPMLDSAKDAAPVVDGAVVQQPAEVQVQTPPDAPVAPPPESDIAAQSEEVRALAAEPIAPVAAEAGTAVTATGDTTINQTVVNNYITNITNITNVTNNVTNVTNNVTNNTQNNIGQQNNINVTQNNVTIVEQVPVREANAGDLITQVILQVGTQLLVNSIGQDTDRFYDPRQDEVYYENLPGGRVREVVERPDGSQVVTVRNRNGDILRRSRITPDGREIVLAYFDERYDNDLLAWRDPGQDLPPLRLNIPVRDYVLDASYADEDEVEYFFAQPPVEQVARLYSIDEVKRSARVRDSVRRLEVGNLTFDTGAATINRDQVSALSSVANAMLALLKANPAETFLIEGHTDAVGSDISNLRLSDLRAATVARILTDFYGVPPENLATQGYGERYLKIRTELGERENRRVTIRRITPLITVANNG